MENKIINLLRKNRSGLTITEIVEKTRLSRSGVRSSLARLEGAKKISFRKIGMAKVYTIK
jgi:DNA-binding IclR family transcriptional regulator